MFLRLPPLRRYALITQLAGNVDKKYIHTHEKKEWAYMEKENFTLYSCRFIYDLVFIGFYHRRTAQSVKSNPRFGAFLFFLIDLVLPSIPNPSKS